MTISHLYPSQRPSLDLNFACTKRLDPRITFTRASTGTYVDETGLIQTAAANEARFDHDPVTGESLGLLMEDPRTNLLLNSATLSTQSATVTAVPTTLSFYGTGTITLTGASTAGPLIGTGENSRVSLVFTPTAGSLTLTVSGTVTNAQLEAGAFPTSYIPTAGSTVTRAADVASITGSNFSSWYNQSEGSFIIQHRHDGVDTDGYLLEIGGTSGNYASSHTAHFIQSTSASLYQSRSYFSGSGSPSSLFQFTKSTPTKVLYGYKSGDYAAGADSVLSTTSQSSWNLLVPTVDNYLGLGRRRDATRSFQQLHISRLTYYPTRLPDATLQTLTL